jgi:hypothetical protein
MNNFQNPRKRMILYIIIAVTTITISCTCWAGSQKESVGLKETVAAQSTYIAHLSTQVRNQDQINANQWGVIEYLSTQLPLALELTTPIPPEVKITPTMYLDIEYPPDMRTDIEEIDKVIDAVLNQDIEARLNLVSFLNTACTTADGLGGPPKCKPNEVDGTPVISFPVSYGEGTHVRPEGIRDVFDFRVRGLFAVYRVPEGAYDREYWPAGEYGIVFTSEEGGRPHVITVLVDSDKIVRLIFHVEWPPFELIKQVSDDFILPPIR